MNDTVLIGETADTHALILRVQLLDVHSSVAYQVFADDDARAATGGEDFLVDAGRLEWEDGDATNQPIRVRIINDDLPEDSERITVLLTDAEGGVGLGKAGQIVEIQANDGFKPPPPPPPAGLDFAVTNASVGEASGAVVLNVSRSGAAGGAVSVSYATSSGSAIAGSDFTSVSDRLTWADGDTADKTITVNLTNDSTDESDETFTVTLSNPSSGAALGSNLQATVTVVDDDSPAPPPPTPPSRANSGGGAVGFLSLMLLGIARFVHMFESCTAHHFQTHTRTHQKELAQAGATTPGLDGSTTARTSPRQSRTRSQ